MTMRGIKTRFVGIATLASLAITLAAALGADADKATDAFFTGAERWGIWAVLCVSMVLTAVSGLIWMVRYTVLRLQEVLDDNTLAFLHFTHAFVKRPCMSDSDAVVNQKELEDDSSPLGATARRVVQRRADRKARES